MALNFSDLLRQADRKLLETAGDSIHRPEVALIYALARAQLEQQLTSLFGRIQIDEAGRIVGGELSEAEFLQLWDSWVTVQSAIVYSVASENYDTYAGYPPDALLDLAVRTACQLKGINPLDPNRAAEIQQLRTDLDARLAVHPELRLIQDPAQLVGAVTRIVDDYLSMQIPWSQSVIQTVSSISWMDHYARVSGLIYDEALAGKALKAFNQAMTEILKDDEITQDLASDDVLRKSQAIYRLRSRLETASWDITLSMLADQAEAAGPLTITEANKDEIMDRLLDAYSSTHRPWEQMWDLMRPALAQLEGWPAVFQIAMSTYFAAMWWRSGVSLLKTALGLGRAGLGMTAAAAAAGTGGSGYVGTPPVGGDSNYPWQTWDVHLYGSGRVTSLNAYEAAQLAELLKAFEAQGRQPPPALAGKVGGTPWPLAAGGGLALAAAGVLGVASGLASVVFAAYMVVEALASLKPLWDTAFEQSAKDDIVRAISDFIESRIKAGASYSSWQELLQDAETNLFPAIDARITECARRVAESAKIAYGRPVEYQKPQLHTVGGSGPIVVDELWKEYMMNSFRKELLLRREQLVSSLMAADYGFWGEGFDDQEAKRPVAEAIADQVIAQSLAELDGLLTTFIGQRTTVSDLETWRRSVLDDPLSRYSIDGLVAQGHELIEDKRQAWPLVLDSVVYGVVGQKPSSRPQLREQLKARWKTALHNALWSLDVSGMRVPYSVLSEFSTVLDAHADEILMDDSGFIIVPGIPGSPGASRGSRPLADQLVDEFLNYLDSEYQKAISSGARIGRVWAGMDVKSSPVLSYDRLFELLYRFDSWVAERLGNSLSKALQEYAEGRGSAVP